MLSVAPIPAPGAEPASPLEVELAALRRFHADVLAVRARGGHITQAEIDAVLGRLHATLAEESGDV